MNLNRSIVAASTEKASSQASFKNAADDADKNIEINHSIALTLSTQFWNFRWNSYVIW